MTFMSGQTARCVLGLLATVLAVAGCGGGGGGGGTGPSLVGTYVGTANTTLRGPGTTVPVSGGIQFVVAADGTVSVSDPGEPPYGTGTLSGNSFVINAPASSLNGPGVSCTGTIDFNGTISSPGMNGTISTSGMRCNGLAFQISGTFDATLRAEARQGVTGVTEMLRRGIRSLQGGS